MKVFLVGLAFAASPTYVFAACEQPSMVMVPDGATATREELLAAQATVKNYMAEMEVYLACVNDELATAGEDAPAEFKRLLVSRMSAAEDEMDSVAMAFNQEVRAFHAAHPGEAGASAAAAEAPANVTVR